MDLKNIIRKVIKEAHEKKLLNEVKIYDISNSSRYRNDKLKSKKYFILHHTAGRGTAQQVVNVLNTRKDGPLGIPYIIDRDAKIYKATKGDRGAHVAYFYSSAPDDMSNSTSSGVEIIASNDKDILIPQCRAALILVKSLGYSLNQVYGHGEVSWNKEPTEGATCKEYFKKYWNKTESEMPEIDNTLNTKSYEGGTIVKVEPAESADYLKYQIRSGKLYNPSKTKVTGIGELKLKGNDGKKIFGFRRTSDKRTFLFKYETLDKVKYLEMDWNDFQTNRNNIVNGKWGDLTKSGASGGVVKSSGKKSETSKGSDSKSSGSESKTSKNIIIGDSTVPYLDNAIQKASRISKTGGESSLWLGGMSVIWLIGALKKYPVNTNVENVIISMGTNGGFGKYLKYSVSELFDLLEEKFPNAKFMVVQGAWGIGTLKNIKDEDVKKYYQKYKDQGATVIEPPIGRVEPHGDRPVYKLIAAEIDSKL